MIIKLSAKLVAKEHISLEVFVPVAPLLVHHVQVLHYVQHVQLAFINQDHHVFHKLIKPVATNIAVALSAQL